MSKLSFRHVAASLFAIVALGHAARLFYAIPVQLGSTSLPFWLSGVGCALAGGLALWGFCAKA